MRFLIFYATVEGHTKKIAETLSGWLEAMGHQSLLTDAGQIGYCDPAEFDGVFACAPIHAGMYPEAFIEFIVNWRDSFAATNSALVTVSLSIASKNADELAEAIAFPRELEGETGWRADVEHNAAGALKYMEYDYFKRWMMRRIAKSEGGPIDTSKDHELTDWDQLEAFAKGFVKNCDDQ